MSAEFELDVEPGERGPGEWVRGTVHVLEGGRSRRLLATLRYRERSPDYSHTAVEVAGGVLHTGDLAAGQRFDFAIEMPRDALPAQRLRHGELYWEVLVTCDKPGIDSYAAFRLDGASAAEEEPEAVDAGAAPADRSGTPLLAPASRLRRSGAARSRPGITVGSIVTAVAIAAVVVGAFIIGLTSGSDDESPRQSVPAAPAPAAPSSSAFEDYYACLDRADTRRQRERCGRRLERAIGLDEPGASGTP